MPILLAGEVRGMLDLRDLEREDAFSDAQVQLLATLAASMSVALDNARLFNETQEALQRQTASAEVLNLISGSMADAQPVFEKILDSSERLFGTPPPRRRRRPRR